MKKIIMIAALLLTGITGRAQYFCSIENAELNYVNYDEVGQSISDVTSLVKGVKTEGDTKEVVYHNKIVTTKSKNNTSYSLVNWSYDGNKTVCNEDMMYGFYIDADRDPDAYDQIAQKLMKDERKYEGSASFEIPDGITAGTAMEERSYKYLKNMLKNEFKISGVIMLGDEQVSTTAGKFDCIKISYLKRTKIVLKTTTVRVTEWYSKGVGLVKSETHDMQGALKGKTLLVKKSFAL